MMNDPMVHEIDLYKNAIYAVIDGQVVEIAMPPRGFGQHTFHWENEKVTRVVHNHIQKI